MRRRSWARIGVAGGAVLLLAGLATYLLGRPTVIEGGAAPLTWADCRPEQVRVMTVGTFHFDPLADELDVMEPDRQEELAGVLDGLADFRPDRIAVEHPYRDADRMDSLYRRYLAIPADSLRARNETYQIGFRLARLLDHERVYPVDVRINLWHDSIAVFDERWPDARDELRGRWDVRYPPPDVDELAGRPLDEILVALNSDLPPGEAEMYRRFLPLVKEEVYAGALKLRPWYDRNLRIVQNLFRALEPEDESVLLVIGSGHVRVLKQILELTPQLCPVDPLPYLSGDRDVSTVALPFPGG